MFPAQTCRLTSWNLMASILYVSSCTGTRSRGEAPPSDTVSPALLTVSDTCAERRRQQAIEGGGVGEEGTFCRPRLHLLNVCGGTRSFGTSFRSGCAAAATGCATGSLCDGCSGLTTRSVAENIGGMQRRPPARIVRLSPFRFRLRLRLRRRIVEHKTPCLRIPSPNLGLLGRDLEDDLSGEIH